MYKIVNFKIQEGFCIWMQFQDGETKIIDFAPLIGKGISAALLDKDFFSQVSIDDGGGLMWPNGMDFCPNYLKEYKPDVVASQKQ